MAGLGYKLFSAGEVLTAANLQGYAVDQSTMVFASSAARTTALPAPDQGMISFLNDSGTTWQYFAPYNVSTNPGGIGSGGWFAMFPGSGGVPFRMAAGTVTTSAGADVTVTFPASRFTVAPRVSCTSVGGLNAVCTPYVVSVAAASMVVALYNTAGSRVAQVMHYNAIQMTSLAATG